jgi:hypothetical protein
MRTLTAGAATAGRVAGVGEVAGRRGMGLRAVGTINWIHYPTFATDATAPRRGDTTFTSRAARSSDIMSRRPRATRDAVVKGDYLPGHPGRRKAPMRVE